MIHPFATMYIRIIVFLKSFSILLSTYWWPNIIFLSEKSRSISNIVHNQILTEIPILWSRGTVPNIVNNRASLSVAEEAQIWIYKPHFLHNFIIREYVLYKFKLKVCKLCIYCIFKDCIPVKLTVYYLFLFFESISFLCFYLFCLKLFCKTFLARRTESPGELMLSPSRWCRRRRR